jgi:hypothetical protein
MDVYVYPSTPVVTAKELAAAKRAARNAKARASIKRNTVAEFMPGSPNHPLAAQGFTVTVLAASTRGRNARGTAGLKRGWGGSQPKSAKRCKRQNVGGNLPVISSTRWSYV